MIWRGSGERLFKSNQKLTFLSLSLYFYCLFSTGRHRCIGESFAYVQIKSIVATMVRSYKLSLPEDPKNPGQKLFPKPDFTRLFVLPLGECPVLYEAR